MTDENKRHNISLEVKRVDRNLRDAAVLRQDGSHESAVSAAYYAAFHAAQALLLSEGLEAKTHAGTIHLLRIHFANPGKLPLELMSVLTNLHGQRQDADYDSATVYTESMAEEAIRQSTAFVEAVRRLLTETGYL